MPIWFKATRDRRTYTFCGPRMITLTNSATNTLWSNDCAYVVLLCLSGCALRPLPGRVSRGRRFCTSRHHHFHWHPPICQGTFFCQSKQNIQRLDTTPAVGSIRIGRHLQPQGNQWLKLTPECSERFYSITPGIIISFVSMCLLKVQFLVKCTKSSRGWTRHRLLA